MTPMTPVPDLPPADVARLTADWEALAAFRDQAQPGWTRRVFSEPYARSRAWLRARMADAGLRVRSDGAGNLIGELDGSDPGLPALVTGSHSDTVASGGRFDGVVGVLGALEVVRLLRDSGTTLRHPLRVVDFLGEEANDFGLSCIGSRAVAGALTAEHLALVDPDGRTLGAALAAHTGGDPRDALAAAWDADDVAAFVELHIEQGRRLEAAGVPIGVVSAIAGIARCTVVCDGRPDHAGTTAMADRRDALTAAAEVVLAVERVAAEAGGDVVGTTGRVAVEPGAVSIVPARARLWAELRSTDAAVLERLRARLEDAAASIGRRRGVTVSLAWTGVSRPVPTDPGVRDAIVAAAGRLGLPTLTVPSGAGHDAAFLARLAPMGMVFVPSRDGRSHCPEEWTDLDQVARGADVLAATLLELDRDEDLDRT